MASAADLCSMLASSLQQATGRGVDRRGDSTRLGVERIPYCHHNSLENDSVNDVGNQALEKGLAPTRGVDGGAPEKPQLPLKPRHS
jgi:hypothetical protein